MRKFQNTGKKTKLCGHGNYELVNLISILGQVMR